MMAGFTVVCRLGRKRDPIYETDIDWLLNIHRLNQVGIFTGRQRSRSDGTIERSGDLV